MRQVTSLHRTLVVLAVGLLALAAPLVAYADGGPKAGQRLKSSCRRRRRPATRVLRRRWDLQFEEISGMGRPDRVRPCGRRAQPPPQSPAPPH